MKNLNIAIFIENYAAGGSDKIARVLIDNLPYKKLFLFVNHNNEMDMLLQTPLPEYTNLIVYKLITIAELGEKANSFRLKNKFIYIIFKLFNLIIRYPLIIYSIVYFYFKFKKYDIDVFFSNNGGYPGGEYCRSATLSLALSKKIKNYHIVHNIATKPFFWLFRPFEFFYDRLIDKVSTIICVSNETKKVLMDVRDIREDPLVIYNGVDSPKLKQYNSLKKDKLFKILTVGVLDSRKNQLLILKSLVILKNKGVSNIKLFIVGREAEIGYKEKLETYASQNDITDMIEFLNFTNPYPYYELCDIFVLSSNIESFALVRVEAMSMNMPVITTNVGDAHMQIENGINGFIIENEKDMAEKITNYANNNSLVIEHGIKSSEFYNKRFTLNKMIENYTSIIEKNYI